MRFAPSLIVVGMNHRILLRLTRIQREDYLWEFVLIRGYKSPQQNISVIRGICGFKANTQIFMGHFRVQSRDFRRNPCRFRGF